LQEFSLQPTNEKNPLTTGEKRKIGKPLFKSDLSSSSVPPIHTRTPLAVIVLFLCLFAAAVSVGVASRCTGSNTTLIACSHQSLVLPKSNRTVFFQTPLGTPPRNGFPFAVFFQGSFASPQFGWSVAAVVPLNGIQQADTFRALLDAGFAVLAPTAIRGLFWQTNLPPYNIFPNQWVNSDDHAMIVELLDAANSPERRFGAPLDVSNAFAFGVSSGGYQSSRVAVDMSSRFRAVVVSNGAYMTCAGGLCLTPKTVAAKHSPTRFLYGRNDTLVPAQTTVDYYNALVRSNVSTDIVVCATCAHEWIPGSADAIVSWFQRFVVVSSSNNNSNDNSTSLANSGAMLSASGLANTNASTAVTETSRDGSNRTRSAASSLMPSMSLTVTAILLLSCRT
jgi:predicted esterase